MSRPMDRQRLTRLTIAGSAALAALVLAVALTWMDARQAWQPEVSGPVLPDWSSSVEAAQEIEIDSAGDRFVLRRTQTGWIMPSRDGYPVRTERLAELDAYLASLQYAGARTADPDKHARLGLAAGNGEGTATQIAVRNAQGEVLTDILLGRQSDGLIYLRFPGRNRTYAARPGETMTELPPVGTAQDWLDLDFLELGGNDIARTAIEPETGPAYLLERPSPTIRNFALRSPSGWRPITAAAGNGPASALSRVRFRDVRDAARLEGEIVARHTAETFAGLRVNVEVMALGDTRWGLVEASALTDDARAAAEALNARLDGWAWLLSDLTLDRLVRPLSEIADPRSQPEPEPEPEDAP